VKPDDPKKDPQKQVRVPLHPALEIIEEAIKRGDFDNLPGKGKPLNLNPKEVSDPTGIANGIRRNANLSTPWEMLRQEIDTAIGRAERELQAAHTQRKVALQRPKADTTVIEQRWQASVAGFEKRAAESIAKSSRIT
jgi:DnaJ family protein C protein 28